MLWELGRRGRIELTVVERRRWRGLEVSGDETSGGGAEEKKRRSEGERERGRKDKRSGRLVITRGERRDTRRWCVNLDSPQPVRRGIE